MNSQVEPQAPPRTDPSRETGESSWATSLLLIIAVAAIVRLAALAGFEGSLQDGMTRIAMARGWIVDGLPIFGRTLWPEGNYVLPAAVLLLWDNPYWGVRSLYAIVGLTNVWLAYRLGSAVNGRNAGAAAGWIVALTPLCILTSTDLATSEAPYISFILLALLAVVRYSTRPDSWLAAAAGLSLTMATMFRFDGVYWAIPVALSIALVARQRGFAPSIAMRDVVILGVCSSIYPAALFLQWWLLYPNPFFIIDQAKHALQFFVDGKHPRWPNWLYQSYVVAFWPIATFVILTPAVAALGWIGVFAAIRERALKASALVAGLGIISAWLAYAAFTHKIQAQWRYALVLSVVLAVFSSRGTRVLSAYLNMSTRCVVVVVVLVALAWQGFITYVAFVDSGTLTRQLAMLSPVRPDQFSSRAMLDWIDANLTGGSTLLLTPHAREQPYLVFHGDPRRTGRIVAQSYFETRDRVYTRESLTHELTQKLKSAHYLATSTSLREIGLRDDMVRELVAPVKEPDGTYLWQGIRLRFVQRFGSNLLWEVLPAAMPG